jgi:hypothetical protein
VICGGQSRTGAGFLRILQFNGLINSGLGSAPPPKGKKMQIAMVLPIKSSPADFTSVKFVQGQFQENSWNSTGVTVWISVTALWFGIVKVMPF